MGVSVRAGASASWPAAGQRSRARGVPSVSAPPPWSGSARPSPGGRLLCVVPARHGVRPGSPRCGVRPAESERAKPEPRRSAWPKRQGSSTRPRSWTGVNPRRVTARDNPAVSPVLSAIRRSTADPVCDPVPIDVDRQIFRPRAVVHLKSAPRPGCPAVSADRITPAQGHFSLFRHATFKIAANGGGRHGRPDGGSVEFRCRRPRRAGGLGSPGAAGPGPVEAPSGDVRDPRIGTGGRGSAELVGPRTSAAWRRTRREGEISAANSVSASAHRPSSSGRPRTRRRPTATSPPRSYSPRDRAPRPARWSPPRRRRSSTEHPRRERSPGSPGGSAGDFLHRRWPGVPGSGRGPLPSP